MLDLFVWFLLLFPSTLQCTQYYLNQRFFFILVMWNWWCSFEQFVTTLCILLEYVHRHTCSATEMIVLYGTPSFMRACLLYLQIHKIETHFGRMIMLSCIHTFKNIDYSISFRYYCL